MIDVIKQMVEALEWSHGGEPVGTAEAIKAGKQLIAELKSQEPVGRFAKFTDGIWREVTDYSAGVPLYTNPLQRKPLTDEQIDDIWNRYCDEMGEASINDAHDIARAIEAAHGIKE